MQILKLSIFTYLFQSTAQLLAVYSSILELSCNLHHHWSVKLVHDDTSYARVARFQYIDDIQKVPTVLFLFLQLCQIELVDDEAIRTSNKLAERVLCREDKVMIWMEHICISL